MTWRQLDRPAVTDFRITARDHDRLQHVFYDRDPSAFRWPAAVTVRENLAGTVRDQTRLTRSTGAGPAERHPVSPHRRPNAIRTARKTLVPAGLPRDDLGAGPD